jgi:penicillin-binding protein-related factor A (putative recombinase)
VAGGIKAKRNGQLFEQVFEYRCRLSHVSVTRIPDGSKRLSQKVIIPIKSPFDYVASFEGKIALLDTKTIEGDKFSHSLIARHQVMEMAKHYNQLLAPCGYVIWFRSIKQVGFISAHALADRVGVRGSFGIKDCVLLGADTAFDCRRIFDLPATPIVK